MPTTRLHQLDAVNINSGTVVLNGTDSATTVNVIARRHPCRHRQHRSGDDHLLRRHAGARHAGRACGTLTITGSVTFEAGSSYQITINPTQNSLGS